MAMDLVEELTAKFGPSNGDGEFLVGMVDIPLDADEATEFGRTSMCLRRAVLDLGFPRRGSEDINHWPGGASINLSPGMKIAVQVAVAWPGQESIGRSRLPTAGEQAAWVASKPPVPRDTADDRRWWLAGFDDEDADLWRGVAPVLTRHSDSTRETDPLGVVLPWKVAGFSADEARQWAESLAPTVSGVQAAHAARVWRDMGFAAEEAAMWAGSWPGPDESPEGARMFRDQGWNPFEVWLLDVFIDPVANPDMDVAKRNFALIDPAHALDMARAGMTPTTPSPIDDPFDELIDVDWDDRLRESFAQRTPIAEIHATYVDHYIWVSYGTELPDQLPFRHEPLRSRRSGTTDTPRSGAKHSNPKSERCPRSGGRGLMLERDGWDEWRVKCPECGAVWGGGGTEPLPEHTRPA